MTKSVIAGADSVSGPPLTPTDPELAFEPVRVPARMPPTLFMVVDTEEEFDWHAPFSRSSTGVTAIAALDNLHGVVDRHRVRPMYVIDYPVATKVEAYSVIREIVESGRGPGGSASAPMGHPAVHRGGERPEQLRLQPGSGAGGVEAAESDRGDRGQRRRASGHV